MSGVIEMCRRKARAGEAATWLFDNYLSTGPDDHRRWPFSVRGGGYASVRFGGRMRYAHAVALELRDGPAPDGTEACHTCPYRDCIAHARWGTSKQNADDKRQAGTMARGAVVCSTSSITEADVLQIRALRAAGVGVQELGRQFGVHYTTICDITLRKTWNWLEG